MGEDCAVRGMRMVFGCLASLNRTELKDLGEEVTASETGSS